MAKAKDFQIGINLPEDIYELILIAAANEGKNCSDFVNDELANFLTNTEGKPLLLFPFLPSNARNRRVGIYLDEDTHELLYKALEKEKLPMVKIVEKAVYKKLLNCNKKL